MRPNVKQLAILALLTVVALIVVLTVNNRQRRQQLEAERAMLMQQVAALAQQSDVLQQNTQAIAEQTAALGSRSDELQSRTEALRDQTEQFQQQIADEREFADQQREHYLRAAFLTEGMQAATLAKTRIAEYYASEGQWPDRNEQIDLDPASHYRGQSLHSMAVMAQGVIMLTFDGKTGVDGGQIRLLPDAGSADGLIKWQCVTSSYSDIARVVPHCHYVAPVSTLP